jgi:hypothetical protein
VSRHRALGPGACLACLYVPTEAAPKNEDSLVAEALGLADMQLHVRQMLATNAPVDEPLLRHIAGALSVEAAPLLPFVGRPLRAFYSEAVCGGVVLRLRAAAAAEGRELSSDCGVAGLPSDRGAMVPMAFQSAMAGILLAAAFVAEAAGLPTPREGSKAVLDLLRPLGTHLIVPVSKHPSGRCLCQDPDFQAAYAAAWDHGADGRGRLSA